MKRSKNMIYKDSAEARELHLVADNESSLYRWREAIENSLMKKVKKGVFNADKAADAFYPFICEVAKLYKKNFGYMFTVTERFTASVEMVRDFIVECECQGVME